MDQYLVEGASYERLIREYEKYGSLTIGVDFDGTVHDFHNTGATHYMVIQLLRELKSIGCKLIIWTCHPNIQYVKDYLKNNDIPYDDINTSGIPLSWDPRKPFFSALLDDRAGLSYVYKDLKRLYYIFKK